MNNYEHINKSPAKKASFSQGLLLGFFIGIALSFILVIFIQQSKNPLTQPATSKQAAIPAQIDDPNLPVPKVAPNTPSKTDSEKANTDNANNEENRFDFYTMLPQSDRQLATDGAKKLSAESATTPSANTATPPSASYYLQIGAFQSAEDADNLKANLALQGFESIIQTTQSERVDPISGKSYSDTWYRVRLGPFNEMNAVNRTKANLNKMGFSATLIK